MEPKSNRRPPRGTYDGFAAELKSRIRGDYGRWSLVELYSGRWAPIWYACLDEEDYCEVILDEEEFFHDENPTFATPYHAIDKLLAKYDEEAAAVGEWILDAHADDLARARKDAREHRESALAGHNQKEPVLGALADAWAEFCVAYDFPKSYGGVATEHSLAAVERAQQAIREYTIDTEDRALFSLLHLLGNASLRMEQELDPEGFKSVAAAVREELGEHYPESDDPPTGIAGEQSARDR